MSDKWGALVTRISGFEVFDPISCHVEIEEGTYFAFNPPTGAFGEGDSESEAVADLADYLGELYETLDAERDKLGPSPEAQLRYLDGHMHRVTP